MESYGRRLVIDRPFDAALEAVGRALAAEGLEVVGRIDLRGLLRRWTAHDMRRYVLLHAAAPEALLAAVREDLGTPTTLPAALAIFELADGETAVIVTEPFATVIADQAWRAAVPQVAAIADRECDRLARALHRLTHELTTGGGRVSAARCRWATPTLLLDPPLCYAAEAAPWSCTRGEQPQPLDTTEVCDECSRWEPRAAPPAVTI